MLNKNLLRGAIVSAGYTQERLACDLNMANSTLTSRMNGTTYFNTEEIDRICDILQITDDNVKINIFLASESHLWDSEGREVKAYARKGKEPTP